MSTIIELYDNGHGIDTNGKYSPDKSLYEYKKARELVKDIVARRKAQGVDARILVPEEKDISLTERCRRVNEICNKYGKNNVILVSVHCNAAGADGKWHDARGFSVFVSKNSSTNSKRCATIFTDEAKSRNLLGNRTVPTEKYWTWSWTKNDIYILKNTNCPAVLTENLFQDNKADVEFLLSEAGHNAIVDLHVSSVEKYVSTCSK